MRKKINNVVKSNVELLTSPFMTFFRHEASSGIILLLFAILALVLANTSLSTFYNEVLNTQMPLGPAKWHLDLTILYWINDGLMAIFFFVIGLEIKREFLFGELKSLSATILPISAAIGGMIVLGPVGLVGGAFVKGNSVTIPVGCETYVQTAADTTLQGAVYQE